MQSQEAEEHLRVIRSLMEKATIYRAISAPTALIAGLIAMLTAMTLNLTEISTQNRSFTFFGAWFAALALAGFANAVFIRQDAKRRGDSFISPGMKMALIALLPAYITAGVVTIVAVCLKFTPVFLPFAILPIPWIVLHGIGLLATTHFAPRSLIYLGWTFLLFGLGVFAITMLGRGIVWAFGLTDWEFGNILMAITFGGFHLIYAACTWPRGNAKSNE